MESLRDKITKQAELFEVNVPEFLTLIQVRKDLKTVKVSTRKGKKICYYYFRKATKCQFYRFYGIM